MSDILDFAELDEYVEGQPVDLLVDKETDLGFKCIINNRHFGVLYYSDVFEDLRVDDKLKGFIKKIRPDGRLDLTLQDPKLVRHKAAAGIDEEILQMLKDNGGFLTITDKTAAEEIYSMFGVSKKKYKIALGGLYKRRLIVIEDKGIRLVVSK